MTQLHLLHRLLGTCISIFMISVLAQGQALVLSGSLMEPEGQPLSFANVSLLSSADSALVKAAYTEEDGRFEFVGIEVGEYFIEASYLGLQPYQSSKITIENKSITLPPVTMSLEENMMQEVVISGIRPIVEVKPDRTVFNVQGTINASGDNGLQLLRKAPGVILDNNDNVVLMGRSGVLFYVDGKQLMLTGDDLRNYLQNLSAEQIDRIDIITNPGSKYDAQGNAGIIDIRLKKDKNLGYNGMVSASGSHGRYAQGNLNTTANYRNKKFNAFGAAGLNRGTNWNNMEFVNFQNGLILNETHNNLGMNRGVNYRIGADYFLTPKSTIGFIYSGANNSYDSDGTAINRISNQETPGVVDSILDASSVGLYDRRQNTYNINYMLNMDKGTLNVDLDYGTFRRDASIDQPNRYFNSDRSELLTEVINFFSTPTDIDIATAKVDYEVSLFGGQLGTGAKFSKVMTDNTFLFYNVLDGEQDLNERRSNTFTYDEQVSAAYMNYARPLSEKINLSAGLRVEHTDAVGELTAFLSELEEEPVVLNYINLFPSAGITYTASPEHVYGFNYSKRINRPDYKVLNPFREQASELAFSKGNPFLQPEIADNLEFNYTFKYAYNFKLAYSHTANKIARLISPDSEDPRAGFITWDNLATQKVYGANFAMPITVNKWWNGYFNLNASFISNEAVYENGATIDINVFTYNIYQQQVFSLPGGYKVEFSGWYSGPGVWEGVMLHDAQYAINLGVQRKFWDNKINVRLNFTDIFFTSNWSGVMDFNGLQGSMRGAWDSRRVNLTVSYDFGNKNVNIRKRKTGLEEESQRIGD